MKCRRGDLVSVAVPLICACFGVACLKFLGSYQQDKTLGLVCAVMIGICVAIGIGGALALQAAPDQAGLAAGLINGVSAGMAAVAVGLFGSKAVECAFLQPRLLAGATLVLAFIMAIALYGLVVALVTASAASRTAVDIAPANVQWFALSEIFANFGALLGSVASGWSIMEIGVEAPSLVMRCMVPMVYHGMIGIYGLLNAVIDTSSVSWPPKGNGAVAGPLYIVSGLGLAIVGHFGVKRLQQKPEGYTGMILGLMMFQTIGFAGLVISLIKHSSLEQAPKPRGRLEPARDRLVQFMEKNDFEVVALAMVLVLGLLFLLKLRFLR